MIIGIMLIAIVAVMTVSLSSDGRDLNFGARDVDQTARERYIHR